MAYQPFYEITDWQELPSQKTPINRPNLLHAENGIKEADKRIVQLDAKKAELSLVNLLVRSIVVDAKTGVITVTQQNGTVTTYDLDIEKVIANFDITDDNVLILTLADGTTKEVDLTKFVNTFSSTATISMSMKDRVVTAEIIDGSVTMDKLDAAIQGEFRQYMLDAQSARDSALQYQKFAKRYAIGDSEFVGSETDNAKYYYEQTKTNAEVAASNAQSAEVDSETATAQAAIATQKATNASASANNAAADAQIATQKAEVATQQAQVATEKAQAASTSESNAIEQAQAASDSALLSKRYAVGGVIAEDTQDNAGWYYQQCKSIKAEVEATADLVIPRFYIDFTTGKLMSDKAAQGMRFWIENGKFYGETEATV